jgi:hypothetical protein
MTKNDLLHGQDSRPARESVSTDRPEPHPFTRGICPYWCACKVWALIPSDFSEIAKDSPKQEVQPQSTLCGTDGV